MTDYDHYPEPPLFKAGEFKCEGCDKDGDCMDCDEDMDWMGVDDHPW